MTSGTLMQIILFVRDMQAEVRFYHDVLRMDILYPPDALVDYSQEMWVSLDAGGCSLALHGGAKHPPGDAHEVIFKVDDLEQTRLAILNAGIKIGDIRILEDGEPIAEGVDPDGHRFAIR